MQPSYLSWIGYFGLMDLVDEFVILDSVQFDRRSWQQRNQIKTPDGPAWLTVPVHSKGKRSQLIKDVEIDVDRNFVKSHIRSIEQNYANAPHFNAYAPALFELLQQGHELLSGLTIELIEWFRGCLGIETPMRRASKMSCDGAKDILLANICRELGADVYVSPAGSKPYLDGSPVFGEYSIEIRYFDFAHPSYRQLHGEFVPYMSIIDLLFNVGDESLAVIRQGAQT